MEILSLDIEGKFAHFRKFHGNNTAMSYSIPPRTTITGMLAAIMGEEKDSYYERYRHENLKIGIRCTSDLKKSFHRLNLLMINGNDDFRGRKGRVQTPFEVVTGSDLKRNSVKYRIYIGAGSNTELYDGLKATLLQGDRQFNLSLGIAGFAAFVKNIQFMEADQLSVDNEWLDMHSACNSEDVAEIDFPEDPELKFNFIEEELLPADFIGGEKGREVYRMNRVLFTTRNFPMHVRFSGKYFKVLSNGEPENIQFLEYAGIFSQ